MSAIELPAPRPCLSCPYRRDVPSGVWSAGEYGKLPQYDGDKAYQSTRVFQCHQTDRDSDKARVCAGWVATHGGSELLALRLSATVGDVDPSVFDYTTEVPVFSSGQEAATHGMRDIEKPGKKARALVAKIARTRADVQYR